MFSFCMRQSTREQTDMMATGWTRWLMVSGLGGLLIANTGSSFLKKQETPGERFEKAMKKKAEYCATHKIDSANRRCDITKLQSADPLATEEGRFAHSVKIPNPVPEDSG
jgi:hypothetical protein